MTYADNLTVLKNETFRGRVMLAAANAAMQIAAEAPSAPLSRAICRQNLAYEVLSNPEANTERFVVAVLTNASVRTSGLLTPDGDLEFVMSTIWDALAGVGRMRIQENPVEVS